MSTDDDVTVTSRYDGNTLKGVDVVGVVDDPTAAMVLAVADAQERARRAGMPAALILPDEIWERYGDEAVLARPAPEGCYWARESDLIDELPPLDIAAATRAMKAMMAEVYGENATPEDLAQLEGRWSDDLGRFAREQSIEAERDRRGYVGPPRNRAERRAARRRR